MKFFYVVFAVMIISSNNAFSQKFDLGSWNIINLKYNLDEKWSFFGETQVRSLKFYTNFHYYEYKGGANFKAHKNLSLTIGAGSYQTYKEGGDFVLPKNNDEFRIWPQIVLMQSLGKLKIEQRYRSEFRFTSNGYRNRFRYRLGLSYPLGKEREGFNPFQFNISNELFFTDKEPYFERNRILFALSYKPSKISTLQIGYLQQLDYKINDETGRDFLQLGYLIDISRKKSVAKGISSNLLDN